MFNSLHLRSINCPFEKKKAKAVGLYLKLSVYKLLMFFYVLMSECISHSYCRSVY